MISANALKRCLPDRRGPMIVADTGAIVALLDASEDHHPAVNDLFEEDESGWIIPSVVLP